jgi:hypothetical protein
MARAAGGAWRGALLLAAVLWAAPLGSLAQLSTGVAHDSQVCKVACQLAPRVVEQRTRGLAGASSCPRHLQHPCSQIKAADAASGNKFRSRKADADKEGDM